MFDCDPRAYDSRDDERHGNTLNRGNRGASDDREAKPRVERVVAVVAEIDRGFRMRGGNDAITRFGGRSGNDAFICMDPSVCSVGRPEGRELGDVSCAYDPSLGRWLSEDPIGLAGGVNLHTYVRGNSVNLLDPLGLWDFKPGTPTNTLQPPMPSIEGRVDDAFQGVVGRDGVVTATTNGEHKQGSKHYDGLAVDLRGRDLTNAQGERVRDNLKKSLGPNYDVLWETYKDRNNNHIHIEYDPKTKPQGPSKPTGTTGRKC